MNLRAQFRELCELRGDVPDPPEPVAVEPATQEPVAVEPDPEPPPQREHLYGSTYVVRGVTLDDVLAARGYGPGGRNLRRSIAERSNAHQQRQAAAERAGHPPGTVLFPS